MILQQHNTNDIKFINNILASVPNGSSVCFSATLIRADAFCHRKQAQPNQQADQAETYSLAFPRSTKLLIGNPTYRFTRQFDIKLVKQMCELTVGSVHHAV